MTHKFRTTIAPLAAVLAAAALATPASARPLDSTTSRPFTESLTQDLRMPDTADAAASCRTSATPDAVKTRVAAMPRLGPCKYGCRGALTIAARPIPSAA